MTKADDAREVVTRLSTRVMGRIRVGWMPGSRLWIDVGVAGTALLSTLVLAWLNGYELHSAAAVLGSSAVFVPLVFRRVAPLAVFGVMGVLMVLSTQSWIIPHVLIVPAFLISFFTIVTGQRLVPSLVTLAAAVVLEIVCVYLAIEPEVRRLQEIESESTYINPWYAQLDEVLWLWVGVFVAARLVRHADQWRRRRAEVAAHRDRQAERQRIARDLHDVIGHAVTLMILQAAAAEAALTSDLARAKECLLQIRRQGGTAIAELHRTLRVLEADDPTDGDVGLSSVAALVESAQADGRRQIRFDETGTRVPLAAGVEVSAYRIVQEGLTNACKYGDPAHPIEVNLDWTSDGMLQVTVANRCPSRRDGSPTPGGRGLIGMHERARAAGGSIEVDTADNQHRVTATLPTERKSGSPSFGLP